MSLDAIDLTDLDEFADGFPHDLFTERTPNAPGGEGYWAITRHADLLTVVRDPVTFSSETGPGRDGAGGTILEDLAAGIGFELAGPVEWGRSNKHTSIRHLPIVLTPA